MTDPLYTKYIVVPTNQCNYYIYQVCVRHAISTTGKYHIDRSNNKRLPVMPAAYRTCIDPSLAFDTRGDAEYYAQTVLMPEFKQRKLQCLQYRFDMAKQKIDRINNTKPKVKFANLEKDKL
jgi:hypothetical protein